MRRIRFAMHTCYGFRPAPERRVGHIHRQRAGAQHLVVEGADVEAVSQFLAGVVAQFKDLQLADLVTQGLSRPDDVAVGLALHFDFLDAGMVVEEVHHLLAVPVLVMQARVHHQADRAQHLVLQVAVVAVRVLVEAQFLAQAFRVQRPALRIGGVVALLAEVRQALDLLRHGQLHVVARHALVQRGGFDVDGGTVLEVAGVDHHAAGTLAIR
ncbi:conserved hypothetical protein [Ricinus communis]|uniref:Uncharacterized protein n=1 Tax=Ricinus communis TaxID=3988 RepID=B9TEU5_RICCO|nr:conserved hypothetical protein [Ricinus communis]